MKKENNKLKFTIIWSSCLFLLLLLVGLGISSNKGTSAVAGDVGSCPTSAPYEIKTGKCCTNSNDTINGSRCIPNGVTIVNGTDCKYSGYSYSYNEYVNNGNKIPNKCTKGTPSCTTATTTSVGTCSCLVSLSSCGTAVQGLVTEKLYTVTLNSNGADSVGATSTNCYATESTSCDAPLPTPTRDGYVFRGWGTSSGCTSGTTGSYKLDANNTGKITLYACWVNANPGNICVKSGGLYQWVSPDSVLGQTGQKITGISSLDDCTKLNDCESGKLNEVGECIPESAPPTDDDNKTECEYQSEGHCISVNGSGNCIYDEKTKCYVKKDNTDSTKKYTVTYNSNDGNGTMASTTCTSGIACATSKNSFTRSCYRFNGWTGSDGKSYSDGASVIINSNLTLTAKWIYTCGGTTSDPSSEPSDPPSEPEPTPDTPVPTPEPESTPSDSNVSKNPPTGEIAIFIVWVVAAMAIVYSVWYFKKIREN